MIDRDSWGDTSPGKPALMQTPSQVAQILLTFLCPHELIAWPMQLGSPLISSHMCSQTQPLPPNKNKNNPVFKLWQTSGLPLSPGVNNKLNVFLTKSFRAT